MRLTERLADFFRPLVESKPFVRYNIAGIGFRLATRCPPGCTAFTGSTI